MKSKAFILFFFLLSGMLSLYAQDDLLEMLEDENSGETIYTTATFKSTRIMNGHSIERMPEGQLDFRIAHRFGTLNSGAYNFWGLDQSNIHLSFEYGINDWLMIGAGRGNYEKTFDGFAKFSILRQSSGLRNMPVSVSAITAVALNSLKNNNEDITYYFSNRLSYVFQMMVARKFNQRFSAQITPTVIHRNLVATELDPNDLYAVGVGGRMKLTNRISFNAEYYYLIRPVHDFMSMEVHNPLSLGFDIETGGHVFQLIFTNSLGMIEKAFIGETTGSWGNGDVRFGFNISRVFTLKSNREK